MQTDTITTTCINTDTGFTCNTPAFFSGGDMFISLCLVILILISIISLVEKAIFSISVHKKYLGVTEIEGKEIYKI